MSATRQMTEFRCLAGSCTCSLIEECRCISIAYLIFAIGARFAFAMDEWTQIWRRPMMKIQTNEVGGVLILQVEGRLAGAFVPELERCWQAARAEQPARRISVDLKSVTCIDRSGRY